MTKVLTRFAHMFSFVWDSGQWIKNILLPAALKENSVFFNVSFNYLVVF